MSEMESIACHAPLVSVDRRASSVMSVVERCRASLHCHSRVSRRTSSLNIATDGIVERHRHRLSSRHHE
eukprot:2714758-Rhodomonas_salina.1